MGKEYKTRAYQVCKRCVMDITDLDIVFDESGICNHCNDYYETAKKFVFTGEEGKKKLEEIVNKIKENGKNNKYDCILGVSGGVDSSYVAYLAKGFGLRVLLVHLDSGWDSETADKNIKSIVEKTNFDMHIYKIDWNELKDLQVAYLKASVINLDIVQDQAIIAAIYEVANKNGIKSIIDGYNFVTEGILPPSWGYPANDLRNLKSIHKKYGELKLKTYPTYGLFKQRYYSLFKGVLVIHPLDYVDYNKKDAKKVLHDEFGWEDYGGKHHESIFTKFYQAYILPTRFNIDKRKAHLSTLICSGQITREEALKELEKPLYEGDGLERDKKYVLEKLGLSEKEFDDLMKLPIKKHQEYRTDEWIRSLLTGLMRIRWLKNLYIVLFR